MIPMGLIFGFALANAGNAAWDPILPWIDPPSPDINLGVFWGTLTIDVIIFAIVVPAYRQETKTLKMMAAK
jgi:hypothetical protein